MSKIRPDIYLFNPTCEYAVANGNASWQPNRLLQKMESDLSTIPMFLAHAEDIILVDSKPSEAHLASIGKLKFDLPDFFDSSQIGSDHKIISIPKNRLLPWGWSPAAHKKLTPLKENCSESFKSSPVFNWEPQHRDLYSKKFARDILHKLLHKFPCEHFISDHYMTEICTSVEDFGKLIKKWGKLMVKAPWSSSGRGLQPITKTPVHEKVWDKLLGIVKDQGYAIAEPFLDKLLDMAFQFELKDGKVSFLGISNFIADNKGQYQGNWLNGLPEKLDKEVSSFAKYIPEKIVPPLIQLIEASKLAIHYEGFFGVDTLIFRTCKNEIRINPCLEINVRQNMGLISLQLQKLIAPERKGIFKTVYYPGKNLNQFMNEMQNRHPLMIEESRIKSGFFPLTEMTATTMFGAYIVV